MRALVLLLVLAGCGGPPAVDAATTNPCDFLPVKQYSDHDMTRLADEVDAAPASTIWPEYINDCAAERDAIRACRTPSK